MYRFSSLHKSLQNTMPGLVASYQESHMSGYTSIWGCKLDYFLKASSVTLERSEC